MLEHRIERVHVKTAVIVPGEAPPWVENHARHVAQRLTPLGRVVVAFTHAPRQTLSLPGQSEQSSLLGHSVSGYPLWMGRVSAVIGFRRRSDDTVLIVWNKANSAMALGAALVSRLRRERLTVVVAERPAPTSSIARALRNALVRVAQNVVELRDNVDDTVKPLLAVAICGPDVAFADLVLRATEAMSDAVASSWQFVLQVDDVKSGILQIPKTRQRDVSLREGQISKQLLQDADVVISPDRSPERRIVTDAVLFGGIGILVGGPVAGRVLRQPDGVWLAKHDRAALIVAFEASSSGVVERPHSVGTMRVLAEDVVALLSEHSMGTNDR